MGVFLTGDVTEVAMLQFSDVEFDGLHLQCLQTDLNDFHGYIIVVKNTIFFYYIFRNKNVENLEENFVEILFEGLD